jgi:ATP-dependent RNA helicase DeaD
MPRDAEVLQHRSGRTGRAGRKGTAVMIVPYPRRRRVEGMLRGARINAEWVEVPSAEAIRERDHERLFTTLLQPVESSEDEQQLADRLLEQMSPKDMAIALVQAHRKSLPEPEELIDLSGSGGEAGGRNKPVRREGFDEVVWFRMDIGRRQNADPRWILPVLCRRGHITRNEIGAIRIGQNETLFQVPRAIEGKFRKALARTAQEGTEDESGIHIEPAPNVPAEFERDQAERSPRRPRGNDFQPRNEGWQGKGKRPQLKAGPRPPRAGNRGKPPRG